jgi:hypothetical protein
MPIRFTARSQPRRQSATVWLLRSSMARSSTCRGRAGGRDGAGRAAWADAMIAGVAETSDQVPPDKAGAAEDTGLLLLHCSVTFGYSGRCRDDGLAAPSPIGDADSARLAPAQCRWSQARYYAASLSCLCRCRRHRARNATGPSVNTRRCRYLGTSVSACLYCHRGRRRSARRAARDWRRGGHRAGVDPAVYAAWICR